MGVTWFPGSLWIAETHSVALDMAVRRAGVEQATRPRVERSLASAAQRFRARQVPRSCEKLLLTQTLTSARGESPRWRR